VLTDGTLITERELAGAFGPESASRVLMDPAGRGSSDLSASRRVSPGRVASEPFDHAPARLDALEREHILDVLKQVNGNRMAAAKVLGISRRALYRRLERHNLIDEAPKPLINRPRQ